MSLSLTELTETTLNNLKLAWLEVIRDDEHEVVAAEYHQIFDRIITSKGWGPLNGRVNQSVFYVVKDERGNDLAIVEIVQSRKGTDAWIKMLDITMSPSIESEQDTEKNSLKRIKVFTSALNGIMNLARSVPGVSTFKIYGRTDLLVAFLRGMHDAMSAVTTLGTLKGIIVSIEGRWLVFRAS